MVEDGFIRRGSTARTRCRMVIREMDEFLAAIISSLRDFADVMLVSEREGEPPEARPMHLAEVEDDGTVWFISRPNSYLLAALEANPAVTVIAQGGGQFVSVGGIAEVYQFPAKLKASWKPSFKRWFPDGPEKSDASAIRVSLVRAARWDMLGNYQHYDAP